MSDGLRLFSSILASGSARTFNEVDRDYFAEDELPTYDFIRNHLRVYRELPAAQTIQEEIGRRMPAANESMQFYLDRIHDRYEYGQIRERLTPLRDAMSRRDMTEVGAQVTAMSRVVRRSRRGQNAGTAISLADAMQMSVDRINDRRGRGISGIPTGWPQFDAITGGYQESDLITWVARMGVGKTYLLLRQAQQAYLAGYNVLFVSTELGAEQIARRYASIELGVNPTYLKNATVSTYLMRRIESMVTGMSGTERFHILSIGMHSKVDVVANLINEIGPDVVYIDGVYLMKPTEISKSANRIERVTGVFDELKAINLEARIPIVSTSQLSRLAGKGGKDGSLENISFTDAIGTHSSVVVGVKFGPTVNPLDSRVFDFFKGREGETGETHVNFKFAPLDMDEFTPEQRAAEGTDAGSQDVDWMT